MKYLLITLLYLFLQPGKMVATTYYVSSSGNDAAAGTSTATAWQTLAKVNSFNFTAGDVVLFKCNEVFFGDIKVHDNNMTYSSYSTGAKPIITGFVTATGWTNLGGGKVEKTITADTTLNVVSVNGAMATIAVGANPDSANGGWKTFGSVVKTKPDTIIAGQLVKRQWICRDTMRSFPAGMTGKHIIVKPNLWSILEYVVLNQMNDTVVISYWRTLNIGGFSPRDALQDKYGWKPYRSADYIDRTNEYVYEGGKLTGRFDTTQVIKYSAVDTLFDNGSFDGTTISGIKFEGGNQYHIWATSCNDLTVTNCDFEFGGAVGIGSYRVTDGLFSGLTFSKFASSGLYINSSSTGYGNITVHDVTLSDIGMWEGLGSWSMYGDYSAATLSVDNNLTVYNINIANVGDCGVKLSGTNVDFYNFYVNGYCKILDDHGAVYFYSLSNSDTLRFIHDGIILNGIGYGKGSAGGRPASNPIYVDGNNFNTNVNNVFIQNFSNRNSYNIGKFHAFTNSTIIPGENFTSSTCIQLNQRATAISNLRITGNIFVTDYTTQGVIGWSGVYSPAAFGVIDSNYYTANGYFKRISVPGKNYTHRQFVDSFSLGSHDILIPVISPSQRLMATNPTSTVSTISLAGNYRDVQGNLYSGSIVLQPYNGKYLVYDGAITTPPVIDNKIYGPFIIKN